MTGLSRVAGTTALVLLASLPWTSTSASAANGHWASIIDLGGDYAEGLAINDRGWVAGHHGGLNGSLHHAFIWTPEQGLHDLPSLGGDDDVAVGINRAGDVVGASGGDGVRKVVLWHRDTINVIPMANGEAQGINDRGVVVGGFRPELVPPTHVHGFVWTQSGGLIDLGPSTWAEAVNDKGTIAGWFDPQTNTGVLPILWEQGVPRRLDLPSLPLVAGEPRAVNNKGDVVGDWSCCQAHGSLMAAWPHKGGFVSVSAPAPCRNPIARGINDRGVIVGFANCVRDDRAIVFLDGHLFDLTSLLPPDSGWQLSSANAINDCNQVTGFGVFNNESHGYLLQLPRDWEGAQGDAVAASGCHRRSG